MRRDPLSHSQSHKALSGEFFFHISNFVIQRFQLLSSLRLFLPLLLLVYGLRRAILPFSRGLFRFFFLFPQPGWVVVEAAIKSVDNAIVNDKQLVANTS